MATNIQCPLRMSDGRFFTDYRPRCDTYTELYEKLEKNNIVKSSNESRDYLQKNAETIMTDNLNNAINNLLPCAPCLSSLTENGTILEQKYIIKCDNVSCKKVEINKLGLGEGVKY